MPDFVRRTCTEIREDQKDDAKTESSSKSLQEFRDADAYVLLGAPGAGKTTTFKQEAARSKAHRVSARDFITFDNRPEWHNTTLFIDGLDEIRAGSLDGRTPLDRIRGKLDRLGHPRFRLSCREADWFGANDRENLKAVSRNGRVAVLCLDPLTEADIRKILQNNLEVDDPEKFVGEAHQRGLGTLLTNPQSLSMLVKAVAGAGGDWPETRMQTFNMACRTLLREHNQDHRVAKPDNIDISHLLDAAGRLCTVQLLTGSAGYALPGTESDHEYLGLEQISGADQEVLRHVLGTKLFSTPSEGHANPVHRQVAEFLGGRYLTGLIENGLPVGRILALMTGDDSGVVSELRGLSAWLASHSNTSRMEIIERDPIGTVLYGDVRDFSIDEKRKLIDGLYQESQKNPWFFGSLEGMDSRFGDLATPDMEPVFREALTRRDQDEIHQELVVVLVEVLRHEPGISKFTDVLLDVVRDDHRRPHTRYRALDTIVHRERNNPQASATLLALLADVHASSVPDPDDELLGRLLKALYPSRLSASEILQYLRALKNNMLAGIYGRFWYDVAMNSTSAQCVELLDILVERRHELWEKIQADPWPGNPAYRLPSNLLVRFLNTAQEKIDPDRLFDWLGLAALDFEDIDESGLNTDIDPHLDTGEKIRSWLNTSPEVQKAIIAMCVECCRGKHNFNTCVSMKRRRRLFKSTPPPDFGAWCLEQALHATNEDVAGWYIREVADTLRNRQHDEGLTREIVGQRLAKHPSLEQVFKRYLPKGGKQHNNENTIEEERKSQEKQQLLEFRDYVKKHISDIRENRCPPALLDQLARAYFGELVNFQAFWPRDGLRNLLGNDTGLIEAVLTAFRDSINRSDVPTDTEIIRLRAGNQRYFLELPFLAGLEELSEPEKEPPLNEKQMKQAIAFYYNRGPLLYYQIHYSGDEMPDWYQWLLASRPEVVSDMLIKFVRSDICSKRKPFFETHQLEFSEKHEAVARLASLPLLKLVPIRCTALQLKLLNVLLIVALFHCEKKAFVNLIQRKLSLRSMNIAQRMSWLTAGFFASPASYRETLKTSVSGHERRIRYLANFLHRSIGTTLFECLDVKALASLIRLLGDSYRPLFRSSDLTQMSIAELVPRLINRLASLPSPDATAALESLSSDNSLTPWRFNVVNAASRQNAIRREASFRHKDVDQVLQVLGNLKPANAADLAALMMDILSDMAKHIRDGDTSDWRQYWNVDSHNRPQDQKPEDGCRDALLSDLQNRLSPLGIDAQPEGYYADDKRADIRVAYGNFNVPMEIKKSTHRDLWRAIREQLITKYTRDPDTDGYGIYLVFWFGAEGCQMPPSGKRPTSAQELQERLLDTLSPDEKFKISICVIDVSKP